MNLLTIDVETTMNGNEESGLSHPMHPDNKVVLYGLFKDNTNHLWTGTEIFKHNDIFWNDVDILVGHNISFDLRYTYKHNPSLKKKLQSFRLWDTQLAEYLLTAQQTRWASLDTLCEKYGLSFKDSAVSDFFKKGYGADLVPREKLTEYLKHDLKVTTQIAKLQMAEAYKLKMFPLIISQMEALHATIEMTFNGLAIDTKYLFNYMHNMELKAKLFKSMAEPNLGHVDVASNKQLSTYLFGGSTKETVKEVAGMYKNGKPKYKNVVKTVVVPPAIPVVPAKEWINKTGVSVDDEVLAVLATHEAVDLGIRAGLNSVLLYRKHAKEHSTYCLGISNHIIHNKGNFIYANINHVNTVTGRLSSSNPNLQNIANSEVKKGFISRYNSSGSLVEFDFSQLEVVILAHVADDKQLINDILTGADIHSELYKDMYKRYPTKEERKPFKSLTFGLLYGAGVKTLSKNASVSKEEAQRFVKTFYTRYHGVANYHNNIIENADKQGKIIPGLKYREYLLINEQTCRRYRFHEYANSEWGKEKTGRVYSFSPTELKNYPVQGMATGDIVPLMLGILFRKFVNNPEYHQKVKMINTVHDSVLFDVHEDVLSEFITEAKYVLDNTHKYFCETFGSNLSLSLSSGCSFGLNWMDMTEVSPSITKTETK